MLHGGGSWSYTYRHNVEELSKSYTVYLIDIPGHGFSEIPEKWDYSLESINLLLKEFFKKQKIETAHIMGHSWGGGWALYFMLQNSNLIDKAVLISSSGPTETNKMDRSAWRYLRYPIIDKIILWSVNFYLFKNTYKKKLFYNEKLISNVEIEEVYKPFSKKENLISQAIYQKKLDWTYTGHEMEKIKRALVIWGDKDEFYPIEMIQSFHCERKIIHNCGHLPHEEKPKDFNESVNDFLKR
jgi:pimeloyl-ACP methyl ester carboxylesterase